MYDSKQVSMPHYRWKKVNPVQASRLLDNIFTSVLANNDGWANHPVYVSNQLFGEHRRAFCEAICGEKVGVDDILAILVSIFHKYWIS